MSLPAWIEVINQPHISKAANPRRWGSGAWTLLDSIAFSYPVHPKAADQERVATFFHALKDVLPCFACRQDFTAMLGRDPIEQHLYSREAFTRWLNKVHNDINAKLGKPYFAYEDYVAKFAKTGGPMVSAGQTSDLRLQQEETPEIITKARHNKVVWLVIVGLLLTVGIAWLVCVNKR